jgi:hypothetical protein
MRNKKYKGIRYFLPGIKSDDMVVESRLSHEFRNANEYSILEQEPEGTDCCAEMLVAMS